MSYAALMVYVDPDRLPEQLVRLAAHLADKFNAALIGLSAVAPLVADGLLASEMSPADIEEIRAKLVDKGNWFRNAAGGIHRNIEWRPVLEVPTAVVAREARSADLIIIAQHEALRDVYAGLDPGGAILRVGRPTLVVPDGVGSLRADRVVIGWKDTREARRALHDAIPFLHDATRVTIVEICAFGEEGAAQERVDDVARYLNRHHIIGSPRLIPHGDGSDAALLSRLAQDDGADLLVTGAYGRTRLGEWIFGGVTRELLTTSPICCLMSH
jgi:nucleotide-binding universal stress UspA family protein